jgi:SAM-dependent methyltransferase
LLELARCLGPPDELRALDVGCGVGLTDAYLGELGSVVGVDISPEVIRVAAETNPTVAYREYDGKRLPFDDGTFDLAFAICVVHHIPTEERARFFAELARAVRPGGLVAIFEHNPANPLTRLAVHRCSFDEDVELLRPRATRQLIQAAGLDVVEARYLLVFPWRSRTLGAVERRLGRVPLGAQYYVLAEKPR